MKTPIKRILSLLIVCAMLLSLLPAALAAQTAGETDAGICIATPKRSPGIYYKVTDTDDLVDGEYILLAEANGQYAKNPCYVVKAQSSGTYEGLASVIPGFTTIPTAIELGEGGEAYAFNFTVSNGVVAIKDKNGNYLFDNTDSEGIGVILKDGLCTWTLEMYDDQSWSLLSSRNNYLALRDDLSTTGSNGNPIVCVASLGSDSISGSPFFYLYRKQQSTVCNHNFTYISNGDGTHEVGCANGCGYSATEDCTMSGGVCTLCDYEEVVEYTITFVVPEGVTAPEPITGSEVILPVPSGSPKYNYNNATFIGWTNTPVNYTSTAPAIYNTTSSYKLANDGALYALYSYSDGNTFTLLDGTKKLSVGDQIIIVARDFDFALSRTQNTNNRATAPITKGVNTVTADPSANVAVLSVGYGVNGSSAPNEYSLHDGSGYLTSCSSSTNQLKTSQTINANSTWSYTLADDATVTLSSVGEYTRNTIRYNTSGLFSCYDKANANLKDIQLYVLSGGTIYTTTFTEQGCTHEYLYKSNGDGTHDVTCANGCGYSATEDCSISGGVCVYCDYEELVEFTVEFVVPSGVEEIEPITGSEVTFPVAIGEPDNNSNNAIFIGWTTAPVDNSSVAPTIYDTTSTYTLEEDMTLYALYGYGGNMIFELYKGSSRLNVGDKIIIVAADYNKALSKTQNSNNRAAADIVKDGTTISVSETGNVAIFTVDHGVNGSAQPSQISLLDEKGYLTSASSSSNYLRTSDAVTENSTWIYTIAPDTYQATITSQGNYTKNTIRYNTSSLFAAYDAASTTMKAVQIYLQTESESGFYTTIFNEELEDCLHEYMYSSNGDGTHDGTCGSCGDFFNEDCDLTGGECPYCGYSEVVEYTVSFVVPAGVNAIEPIVGSELTFPVPTGTPNNNYKNATFVGWVTNRIESAATAPNYYDTTTSYTLNKDLTVYALYTYSGSGSVFTLYTGSKALNAGDQVIIVAKDYDFAISSTQNTSNRKATEIVKNGNQISVPAGSDVAIFTVGWGVDGSANMGVISLSDTNGYLRASSSSANQLKSSSTLDANGSWAYVINAEDYSVALTAQGNYTKNTMRYNKTSTIFSCYDPENSQYDLHLYTLTSGGASGYTTEFPEACTHPNTSTDTEEATCTAPGSVTVTCNSCGETISTEQIAPFGHNYVASDDHPSCTESVIVTYTCTECGDSYTEDMIAEGHSYESVVTSVLSCTTDGVTTYTCINCGESYTERETATGHSYGNGVVTTPASCTTNGVKTFTCANCGDSYTEIIASSGHNYSNFVTIVEPSCTDDGLKVSTCANCGDTVEEAQEAYGHEYDDGVVIVIPSCTTNGSSIYTCLRCGNSRTEEITATGHNYNADVTPPSCLEGGYTTMMCPNCGDSYITNHTAATGHNYDVTVVEPTCTSEGYFQFLCQGCGDNYTSDHVSPTGHNYTVETTEATCTEPGSKVYDCENCGDHYTETIEAIGHQVIHIAEIPATCISEGKMEHYQCSECGKLYIDAEAGIEIPESYLATPATGHTIVKVEKIAATCTTDGCIEHYKCSGCSTLYIDVAGTIVVPESYVIEVALGHDYKTVVTAPSCTEDGYTTTACANCGDSSTSNVVAALGHSYSYTDNGETHTQTCVNCSESVTVVHSWGEGTDLTEGTCSAYSKFSYTCEICNAEKIVTNGEPNHVLTYNTDTSATCEADGCSAHYACSQCGNYYADAECTFQLPASYIIIPATGHSYSYTNNGTNHTKFCANGGESVTEAHAYENGLCICGANEPAEPKQVYNANLTLTMSIGVGAEMQVFYTVLNSKVKSYQSFYVEVVKNVAGGQPVKTIFSVAEGNMDPFTNAAGSITRYMATYTGIAAKEMGDSFTATVYAVAADGTIYYGPSETSSIKDYLMEQIDLTTSSAELKTLAVDMLHYGAAAQINFAYDTANLVNSDLTAAQLALGTQEEPSAINGFAQSASGCRVNTSVSIGSKVELYLTFIYKPTASSKMELRIKNAKGDVIETLTPDYTVGANYRAVYDNVGAKQMRELITIELYDNGTLVSKSTTWSVESYVAQVIENSASAPELVNVCKAMLTYGDSAAIYLEASGQ